METVVKPYFKVLYDGRNITEDISKHLLSITYTDKVTGESDELEITLEDKDGLWSNEWYPEKGSMLTAEIGYNNGEVLSCGVFQIDEIEISGPPDIVNIKALATGIHSKLRTKRSYAHEHKTLPEIINTIAAKNGFKIVGDIENIKIDRVTQYRETDLRFLNRLAAEYGYAFSIRDKTLVFHSVFNLEARNTVLSIDKTECSSYSFKDKTSEVYKGSSVKFNNPHESKTIKSEYSVNNDDSQTVNDRNNLSQGDTLEIRTKTENEQQANVKAKAAYHRKNSLQQTGSITAIGNILLVSGNNIELTGFGGNTGLFHILSAKHSIDKSSGYAVSCELKRIKPIQEPGKTKPKQVPTKGQKLPPSIPSVIPAEVKKLLMIK